MSRRRGIEALQNLAIALLAASALLLVLLVVSYESGRDGRLPSWQELFPPAGEGGTASASDLTARSAPVDIVVTNQYGRGSYLLTADDPAIKEQLTRLLQEALGSAGSVEAVTEDLFRAALNAPGVYFDYLVPLPAAIVASRIGAETDLGGQFRRALLSREGEAVRLYLWDGAGTICRYPTAVSPDVLTAAVDLFGTDDTFFAFEGGEDYEGLDPYSVLQLGKITLPTLTAASAPIAVDTLLSHLDFGRSPLRYPEAGGTVVVENLRTLRIRPDGVLLYTGDTPAAAGSLLDVAGGSEHPSAYRCTSPMMSAPWRRKSPTGSSSPSPSAAGSMLPVRRRRPCCRCAKRRPSPRTSTPAAFSPPATPTAPPPSPPAGSPESRGEHVRSEELWCRLTAAGFEFLQVGIGAPV